MWTNACMLHIVCMTQHQRWTTDRWIFADVRNIQNIPHCFTTGLLSRKSIQYVAWQLLSFLLSPKACTVCLGVGRKKVICHLPTCSAYSMIVTEMRLVIATRCKILYGACASILGRRVQKTAWRCLIWGLTTQLNNFGHVLKILLVPCHFKRPKQTDCEKVLIVSCRLVSQYCTVTPLALRGFFLFTVISCFLHGITVCSSEVGLHL